MFVNLVACELLLITFCTFTVLERQETDEHPPDKPLPSLPPDSPLPSEPVSSDESSFLTSSPPSSPECISANDRYDFVYTTRGIK